MAEVIEIRGRAKHIKYTIFEEAFPWKQYFAIQSELTKNRKLANSDKIILILIHLLEAFFTVEKLPKANSSETTLRHERFIPEDAKVIPK